MGGKIVFCRMFNRIADERLQCRFLQNAFDLLRTEIIFKDVENGGEALKPRGWFRILRIREENVGERTYAGIARRNKDSIIFEYETVCAAFWRSNADSGFCAGGSGSNGDIICIHDAPIPNIRETAVAPRRLLPLCEEKLPRVDISPHAERTTRCEGKWQCGRGSRSRNPKPIVPKIVPRACDFQKVRPVFRESEPINVNRVDAVLRAGCAAYPHFHTLDCRNCECIAGGGEKPQRPESAKIIRFGPAEECGDTERHASLALNRKKICILFIFERMNCHRIQYCRFRRSECVRKRSDIAGFRNRFSFAVIEKELIRTALARA